MATIILVKVFKKYSQHLDICITKKIFLKVFVNDENIQNTKNFINERKQIQSTQKY